MVRKIIDSALTEAGKSVTSALGNVENALDTAKEVIDSTVDSGVSIYRKTIRGLKTTAELLLSAGIVFGAATATVPTIIAVSVLTLIILSVSEASDEVDDEMEERKRQRLFDRGIKQIKKYGAIPVTSVFKSDSLEMEMNAETNDVKGVVKRGVHKGKNLSELSLEDLTMLRDTSPDDDVVSMLDAYIRFTESRAKV